MFIGRVAEVFDIRGRGVVITLDVTYAHLPRKLRLKIGDAIELRTDDAAVLQTHVAGIEHCDPWTPKQLFTVLLPRDVKMQDIPRGAEAWTTK